MVVNEDDLARNAVPHDRGAPREVCSLVEGARVEPDFDAWGADLVPAVTDVVSHHVEGRGVGFDCDVSPRVSFLVVRDGLGVTVARGLRGGLSVAWGRGSVASTRRS